MSGQDEPQNRLPQPFEWLLRNRHTGGVTIAQFPNLTLSTFLAAIVVRRLAEPRGTVGTVVAVMGTVALLWWAVDELVRGVNPWRRILGATVLAVTLVGLVLRLVG